MSAEKRGQEATRWLSQANGLPDLTPSEVYADPDAEAAIRAAEKILRTAERLLGATKRQDAR